MSKFKSLEKVCEKGDFYELIDSLDFPVKCRMELVLG
jgi:hypothetical protein